MNIGIVRLIAAVAMLGGCQSPMDRKEESYFAAATPRDRLPQEWLAADNYACIKTYQLHVDSVSRHPLVIDACRASVAAGWPPALTATGAIYVAARDRGDPRLLAPMTEADARRLLARAAELGEPLAMSLHGAELGGEPGRQWLRRAAERGQKAGVHTLINNALRTQPMTEAARTDVAWGAAAAKDRGFLFSKPMRARMDEEIARLPEAARQAAAADAATFVVNPQAATPVSPMVAYDTRAAVRFKHPTEAGRSPMFLRLWQKELFNPDNAGLALVLADDPEAIAQVRREFAALARP